MPSGKVHQKRGWFGYLLLPVVFWQAPIFTAVGYAVGTELARRFLTPDLDHNLGEDKKTGKKKYVLPRRNMLNLFGERFGKWAIWYADPLLWNPHRPRQECLHSLHLWPLGSAMLFVWFYWPLILFWGLGWIPASLLVGLGLVVQNAIHILLDIWAHLHGGDEHQKALATAKSVVRDQKLKR